MYCKKKKYSMLNVCFIIRLLFTYYYLYLLYLPTIPTIPTIRNTDYDYQTILL